MKQLILPIVVIVSVSVGVFAGQQVKSMGSNGQTVADGASKPGAHDNSKEVDVKDKKQKPGKKKSGYDSPGDASYFEFAREFIVPLLSDGKVSSLVIISITLEVPPSISDKMFGMEPKLRDNILTSLIGLANDPHTFKDLTTVQNYETIRSVLLANLRNKVASDIGNVLITDVAKQDV